MSIRVVASRLEVTTNPGAAHLRVKVAPCHLAWIGKKYWQIRLINTRTGRVITTDAPFFVHEDAMNAAAWLCTVARESWSWDWTRGELQ